jgi:hypothetical protein
VTVILCAPVTLHPATRACLERDGIAPVWLQRGDKHAYWHAIRERWTGEDDLIIIEQDMEWTAAQLAGLKSCDFNWCTYQYDCFSTDEYRVKKVFWCLGFTRISAFAQRQRPAGTVEAKYRACRENCGGAWYHLDWHIAEAMKGEHCGCCQKVAPHVHGEVIHHHDYQPAPELKPSEVDRVDPAELTAILRARGWQHPERVRLPRESAGVGVTKISAVVVDHVQRG